MRTIRTRSRRLVPCVIGCVVALAACSGGGATEGGTASTVTVAVPSFYSESSLPWNMVAQDFGVWDGVYDYLVRQDNDSLTFGPGLAESWEVAPDGMSYTFRLRPGVPFHSGYGELTSADVKFTIDRMLDPSVTGGSTGYFKDAIASVDAPDDRTVVVHLEAPNWTIPEEFARKLPITSQKYIEEVGDEGANLAPVGTGPYEFVEGASDRFTFEAVPDHWRETAEFERLVVRRIPDSTTTLSALRNGEVDIAPLGGDYVVQAEDHGLNVFVNEKTSATYVALEGMSFPGTADYCPDCPWVGDREDPESTSYQNGIKVRKALAMAIDHQAILDTIYAGYGSLDPQGYFAIPGRDGYPDSFAIESYDPDGAKELLAEAGYPDGFSIPLLASPQTVDAVAVIQAIAQYWEAIGLEVDLKQSDSGSLLELNTARKPSGAFFVGSAQALSGVMTVLPHTAAFRLLVHDSQMDEYAAEIGSELDEDKRAQLIEEVGQQLVDEEAGIRVAWRSDTYVANDSVADYTPRYARRDLVNFEYLIPSE